MRNLLTKRNVIIVSVLVFLLPIIVSFIISSKSNFSQQVEPPPKEVAIEYSPIPLPSATLAPKAFTCPSVASFCAQGQGVEKDGKYLGFGAILPSNSVVKAAFDGEISSLPTILPPDQGGEKILTVYLDNKQLGLRAVYEVKGEKALEPKTVKAGDTITQTSDIMSLYNVSLLFSVIRGDPILGEIVKLTREDFK